MAKDRLSKLLELSPKVKVVILSILAITLPFSLLLIRDRLDLRNKAQTAPLNSLVNPIGFAKDINLSRIDNTVYITNGSQVSNFLNAARTPWTRIIVSSGVTLNLNDTLRPATGVKIYSETGSFTIDGSNTGYAIDFNNVTDVYMANFILKVPVGDTSAGNNPASGIHITNRADNLYFQSFNIDNAGDRGGRDAAESFNIWNNGSSSDAPKRITFDRGNIIVSPSHGTKGFTIGGGDASQTQITIAHSVLKTWQRGPMVQAGAFVDYYNNVIPRGDRIYAIGGNSGGKVRIRASYIHRTTDTSHDWEIENGSGFNSVLGPETNQIFEGANVSVTNGSVPTPPYSNPPYWSESEVMQKAGAGTLNLSNSASNATPTPNTSSSSISPWNAVDIGSPMSGGQSKISEGNYDIQASGNDIWGNSDQFRYAYQNVTGNFTITTQITGLTHTDPWAKAGLMVRTNENSNSAFVFVHVTPNTYGINFVSRNSSGSYAANEQQVNTTAIPKWIRITKSNNSYTAYISDNGSTFSQIGQPKTIDLGTNPLVGMAATSHNNSSLTTASFRNVTLSGTSVPTPTPTITSQSTSQSWTGIDIGNTLAGRETVISSGNYDVTGGGADIWGNQDAFRFLYKQVNGDFTFTTKLESLPTTNPWVKAGLMVRSSLNAASQNIMIQSFSQNGANFQYRANVGGSTVNPGSLSTSQFPVWLRLIKAGNTYTAYTSTNGVNYTQKGTYFLNIGSTNLYVGMAVTSHDASRTETARFRDVTLTGPSISNSTPTPTSIVAVPTTAASPTPTRTPTPSPTRMPTPTQTANISGSVQTPWQGLLGNISVPYNYNWNYTMGYRFIPQKDGRIVKLGGIFNGNKKVLLWDYNSRQILAETTVNSNNTWVFSNISPVDVKKGKQYMVAVKLEGTGGVIYGHTMPRTILDIHIDGICYSSGDTYPANCYSGPMYGIPDIGYIPN